MGDTSPERRSACGLLSAVFGRRSPVQPKSTTSLPTATPNTLPRVPTKRDPTSQQKDRIIARPLPNNSKTQQSPPVYKPLQTPQEQQITRKAAPGYAQQSRKVPQGALGLSGELDSMIIDHQKSKGATSLVRASSGNVMLHKNLGNLGQQAATNFNNNGYEYDYQPTKVKQEESNKIVAKKESDQTKASLCRVISTKMDPEKLKIMGNEDYKNGRFAEALSLYDAAISIDPNKASYRSNKSAALSALGRLLEAVLECREAIRIEPFYQRAHNRLATLYLRLGEAEKVMYHHKQAGGESEPEILEKARNLQLHLEKCTEAKKQRDWNNLYKESSLAISAGADSAPMIFALQAEALLRLNRHQEADETMKKALKFDVDEYTKFFGPIGNATLLVIRAQIDMVLGRFDDAVGAAQQAARLDSNNKEASVVLRKTKAVANARSNGNGHFMAGRYSDACNAYGEGLNHDPFNSVLLCNRAACRTKLGQYEQAVEDCNASLSVRPNFIKARLRRADCYSKMQKWEACIQDCEELIKVNPNDEEGGRLLKDAQAHLKEQ